MKYSTVEEMIRTKATLIFVELLIIINILFGATLFMNIN